MSNAQNHSESQKHFETKAMLLMLPYLHHLSVRGFDTCIWGLPTCINLSCGHAGRLSCYSELLFGLRRLLGYGHRLGAI